MVYSNHKAQSFDEDHLKPEGTFKAAQAHYTSSDQINKTDLQRWLKKAREVQWGYKNIPPDSSRLSIRMKRLSVLIWRQTISTLAL